MGVIIIDDNELMKLIRENNKEAFEKLVIKYRVMAINFAKRYLQDSYLVEDIVQEAFATIYINREKYKNKNSFKTYLYTIIRNKAVDEIRRGKNNYYIEDVEESVENLEINIIRKERMKFINKALSMLKYEYKIAIYLYAIEELTYKEIAKIMNKSVPQIKITIFRARKKLQEIKMEEIYYENR